MGKTVTVLDEDNILHTLIVRKQGEAYSVIENYGASSGFNSSPFFPRVEEAVEYFTAHVISANCAKQFEKAPLEHQQKILQYIREHFVAGTTKRKSSVYSSYGLKHVVERGIGEYVSNGELKGAMLKAGFTVDPQTKLSDINWGFSLKKL